MNIIWSSKQTQLQSHRDPFLCNGNGQSAPSCFLSPVKVLAIIKSKYDLTEKWKHFYPSIKYFSTPFATDYLG